MLTFITFPFAPITLFKNTIFPADTTMIHVVINYAWHFISCTCCRIEPYIIFRDRLYFSAKNPWVGLLEDDSSITLCKLLKA